MQYKTNFSTEQWKVRQTGEYWTQTADNMSYESFSQFAAASTVADPTCNMGYLTDTQLSGVLHLAAKSIVWG